MTLIKGCLINLSNRLPPVRKQTTRVRLERGSGGLASALDAAFDSRPQQRPGQ